jgi:hypothetical protein
MSDVQIEVSLGPEGGPKVFNSIKELEDWFAQERQFWSTLLAAGARTSEGNRCLQPLQRFLGNVNENLNQARSSANSAQQAKREFDPTPHITSLKANIANFFDRERVIPSHTPRAKFLMRLAETQSPEVAVFAYGFFIETPVPYSLPNALKGALAASYYDSGFTERALDEKQALDELRASWEKNFQAFRNDLQRETEQHQKLNAEATESLDSQKRDFSELIKKETNAWAALHKTYDEQLSLYKPVQYWTKKAVTHRWLAWAFGIVAILVGVGVFGLLYELIQLTVRPTAGTQDLPNWHPEYWRIAVLVAAGLFSVWVVRIFVRLFLSNVHLLTDARERATMVQTYLALMRKGGLKEEDRQIILKALFRPTATGVVKDDAMPLTMLEALTKLGK